MLILVDVTAFSPRAAMPAPSATIFGRTLSALAAKKKRLRKVPLPPDDDSAPLVGGAGETEAKYIREVRLWD